MSEPSYEQRLAANGAANHAFYMSLPVVVIEVRDRHRQQSRDMVEYYRWEENPEWFANIKAQREHTLAFKEQNPGQNLPPARYQYVDVPGDE